MGKHRQKSDDKAKSNKINLIIAITNLINTMLLLIEKLLN